MEVKLHPEVVAEVRVEVAKEAVEEEAEEVAIIAAGVETQTKDFILKQLYKNYKGNN